MNLDDFLARLEDVGADHNGLHSARCPVCNSKTLMVGVFDYKISVNCSAGCSEDEICTAMGVTNKDLYIDRRKKLDTVSARELQKKEFAPMDFVVKDFMPKGLGIVAAASKIGKSWFVLDMCLKVSAGERFLDKETTKGECLYLALEDTQRRLQDRMNKILDGGEAPEGFFYATASHSIDDGLLEELEVQMEEHPETSLIVIDTLEKVRPSASGKDSAYSKDYKDVGALKAFADEYNVCVLLVHHIRKMSDDSDPFNRISGTNAIMGAADTILLITKEKRDSDEATLTITGRDIESENVIMQFNKSTFRWEIIGNAKWIQEQRQRLEYNNNPIVVTIKSLLHEPPYTWSGTATDLLNHCRRVSGEMVAISGRELTCKVKKLVSLLLNYDGIEYSYKRNGSGGGLHTFNSGDVNQEETVGEKWETVGEQEFMDDIFK